VATAGGARCSRLTCGEAGVWRHRYPRSQSQYEGLAAVGIQPELVVLLDVRRLASRPFPQLLASTVVRREGVIGFSSFLILSYTHTRAGGAGSRRDHFGAHRGAPAGPRDGPDLPPHVRAAGDGGGGAQTDAAQRRHGGGVPHAPAGAPRERGRGARRLQGRAPAGVWV
jgi:hypothetical protein